MNIPPIGLLKAELTKTSPADTQKPEDVRRVSQQFESILLRQFLTESMKSLLEEGPSGQVYGYMVTDTLADSISKGGGLGLCSIIQSQLGNEPKHAKP